MVKVKIRDTNSVFDGMSGTVESEDGDKVTVMVDFKAGRKVRNTFNKSCISGLDEDIVGVDKEENVNEDIEEDDPENDDADYLSKEEKCKLALSEYLEVGADKIELDREDDNGYVFEVSDDVDGDYSGSIWWVFMSYNDAYNAAYDRFRDYIEYDADLVDYFGYDTLMDYIDDDAFDDQMDSYYSDYVWYDMDQEDIIDECERRGILDPDDKEIEKVTKYRVLDGGEDVYEDDFETEEEAQAAAESYNADEDLAEDGPFTVEEYEEELTDEATYTEEALDRAKDELVEDMKNEWSSSLDWYRDTYGEDSLRDDIRHDYVSIDVDRLIDDYFTDDEIVYQLAWYDNEEQYIEVEWLNQDFYLYRRE